MKQDRCTLVLNVVWLTAFIVGLSPTEGFSQLTPQLTQALEANRMGRATRGQQALLFQNNDVINAASLNGWIPDSTYQAAQATYSETNQAIARAAAEATGATFNVQVSKSQRFSPGTDSDFIVQVQSSDPVGQIAEMQEKYNAGVNKYLEEALSAEGMVNQPRIDWHNRLDVDFMADPSYVTDKQFREIAYLNNDAYRRRNAAEYERVSRSNTGETVTPELFSDYAAEMKDFIRKKQERMAAIRANPELLNDPAVMAEYQRLMAQEQKYIERIESANRTLRGQEGLAVDPPSSGPPVYEMRVADDGSATIRKRPQGSVAARGAQRSFVNRIETINASALADNSLDRALSDLAESMAQAAVRNPEGWSQASSQIAEITGGMRPAARGQLIERIRHSVGGPAGDEVARNVAAAMRDQVRRNRPGMLQQLDNAIGQAFQSIDDLGDFRTFRQSISNAIDSARAGLDRLPDLEASAELLSAAADARTYIDSLQRAMDPNLTEEEAEELFSEAHDVAWSMAQNGILGALAEASPPFGAMLAGWSLGYDGTRFVIENTETGRRLDRAAEELFDRHQLAVDRAMNDLTEYFGGQSDRMQRDEQLRDLEASYWQALRDGRIRMRPGVRTLDIAALIRSGDLSEILSLVEPGPNASQAARDRFDARNPLTSLTARPEAVRRPVDHSADLEFIPQTRPLDADEQLQRDLDALASRGESMIGDSSESQATRRRPREERETRAVQLSRPSDSSDYRARALALAGGRFSTGTNYRDRARQIERLLAEREEAQRRQSRAQADLQRQREAQQRQAFLEQQRQEQLWRQAIEAERRRQQFIAHQLWLQQQQRRQVVPWGGSQNYDSNAWWRDGAILDYR